LELLDEAECADLAGAEAVDFGDACDGYFCFLFSLRFITISQMHV
jgi:hypothetical protein